MNITELEMLADLINDHLETLSMDADLCAEAIESEDSVVVKVRNDDFEVAYVEADRGPEERPCWGPEERPCWSVYLWVNTDSWINKHVVTTDTIESASIDCVLAIIKQSIYRNVERHLLHRAGDN